MPPPEQWEAYFEPVAALEALGCRNLHGDCVEFGCGYGTFTIAAAARCSGTVYALDIDPAMVKGTSERVTRAALQNVVIEQRDFTVEGCGRPDSTASFVMLFNLLHIENPVALLREARRVLRPGGTVGVTHWKVDPSTPRGPSLAIRPHPEQCRAWGEQAGLRWVRYQSLPGSPWHWGMVLKRT